MDKLLVVSSYPPKGEIHYKKTVGIASYTKNTLLGIKSQSPSLEILVFGEKLDDGAPEYEDENIKVKRIWKRKSFSTFPILLSNILKSNYKNILFEFEVSMFGNIIQTAPFPFFILLLRLLGKRVTIVLHQSITNLSEFEGHTDIRGTKAKILGLGINLFYYLLILFSNKIIVFEKSLTNNLPFKNKIFTIPHGVQKFDTSLSKNEAKIRIGISQEKEVLLVFGYLAWYKGTDLIINIFNQIKNKKEFKDFILIIAGGPNPNHKDKKFYADYVSNITNSQNEQVRVTGFVEEKDIAVYYQASDAVLLPYRAFMSASGPLSIAYSFGKPAFISKQLLPILETEDIKLTMNKLELNDTDLVFDLNQHSFEGIAEILKDKDKINKIERLSEEIANNRQFANIGKKYLDILIA